MCDTTGDLDVDERLLIYESDSESSEETNFTNHFVLRPPSDFRSPPETLCSYRENVASNNTVESVRATPLRETSGKINNVGSEKSGRKPNTVAEVVHKVHNKLKQANASESLSSDKPVLGQTESGSSIFSDLGYDRNEATEYRRLQELQDFMDKTSSNKMSERKETHPANTNYEKPLPYLLGKHSPSRRPERLATEMTRDLQLLGSLSVSQPLVGERLGSVGRNEPVSENMKHRELEELKEAAVKKLEPWTGPSENDEEMTLGVGGVDTGQECFSIRVVVGELRGGVEDVVSGYRDCCYVYPHDGVSSDRIISVGGSQIGQVCRSLLENRRDLVPKIDFLVDASIVGGLIGKKGEKVRGLRRDFGASIQILDPAEAGVDNRLINMLSEKIVRVESARSLNVLSVVPHIYQVLEERFLETLTFLGTNKTFQPFEQIEPTVSSQLCQVIIILNKEETLVVEGKIPEIWEKSGASLDLMPRTGGTSQLLVEGSRACVREAIFWVCRELGGDPYRLHLRLEVPADYWTEDGPSLGQVETRSGAKLRMQKRNSSILVEGDYFNVQLALTYFLDPM